MSLKITIVDAADVRNMVQEKFGVKLHIHDTCGSFYTNIDEANSEISDFVIEKFKEMGQEVDLSEDGCYFFFD